jgi:hypothetical protein
VILDLILGLIPGSTNSIMTIPDLHDILDLIPDSTISIPDLITDSMTNWLSDWLHNPISIEFLRFP